MDILYRLPKKPFRPAWVLCAALSVGTSATAAPNDGISGLYARVDVGRSTLDLNGSTTLSTSRSAQAVKLFAGYRLDAGWGLELGHAWLGSLDAAATAPGASPSPSLQARSLYGAFTGRWPLGSKLAVHGRLGASAGRVHSDPTASADPSLAGRRTAWLAGLGLEYRPRPQLVGTVSLDDYGRLADRVQARAWWVGLHLTF